MNDTTLSSPLPLRDAPGRGPAERMAWAPTQPSALEQRLTPVSSLVSHMRPGQLSLPRAMILATIVHVLIVLLVGTQQGAGMGGGGQPSSRVGNTDISIRLQSLPTALAVAPTPSPPVRAPAVRQPTVPQATSRRPPAPAAEKRARAAAPDLGPVPLPQAGRAPQGAVLRGQDAGLPAAPSMADLQPPPVPPIEAPPLPPVIALPAPQAPDRSGAVRSVTQAPPAQPAAPATPPDTRPQQQPALIPAERPSLPRAEESTQGAPTANRKVTAAPAQAPRLAAPLEADSTAMPVSPGLPVETQPASAQAQTPAATAVAPAPAPTPAPVPVAVPAAPPVLQNQPVQTQLQARELLPPTPAALPEPPVATAPVEPRAPRVLTQRAQTVSERPPVAIAPAAMPDLPSVPAVAAPTPAVATVPAGVVSPAAPAASPLPSPASLATGARLEPAVSPAAARVPIPGVVQPGVAGPGAVPAAPGLMDGLRGIVNVPPPPALAASAPGNKLNLELPRAGSVARPTPPADRMTPLRLDPPPTDPKSKLARDVEKAGKADCRTAHSEKGILAAPALAIDALRKDGCKW